MHFTKPIINFIVALEWLIYSNVEIDGIFHAVRDCRIPNIMIQSFGVCKRTKMRKFQLDIITFYTRY